MANFIDDVLFWLVCNGVWMPACIRRRLWRKLMAEFDKEEETGW